MNDGIKETKKERKKERRENKNWETIKERLWDEYWWLQELKRLSTNGAANWWSSEWTDVVVTVYRSRFRIPSPERRRCTQNAVGWPTRNGFVLHFYISQQTLILTIIFFLFKRSVSFFNKSASDCYWYVAELPMTFLSLGNFEIDKYVPIYFAQNEKKWDQH